EWWNHVFEKPDAYVALFTGLLFVSTAGLWWSARGLQKATYRSIRLAREEFISSHRPRLKIKFVQRSEVAGKVAIIFSVVNVGTSDAVVISSGTHVGVLGPNVNEWPNPHDYGTNSIIPNLRFKPGATGRFTVVSEIVNPIEDAGVDNSIVLYGYVVY